MAFSEADVQAYVSRYRGQGYSDQQLRAALTKNGVASSMIDPALSGGSAPVASRDVATHVQEYVKKFKAEGYPDEQIRQKLLQSGADPDLVDKVLMGEAFSGGKSSVPFYKKTWFFATVGAVLFLAVLASVLLLVDFSGVDSEPTCVYNSDCGADFTCDVGVCVQDVQERVQDTSSGSSTTTTTSTQTDTVDVADDEGEYDVYLDVEESCVCDSGEVCDDNGLCVYTACYDGEDNDADGYYDFFGACLIDGVLYACSDADCETACGAGTFYGVDPDCDSIDDLDEMGEVVVEESEENSEETSEETNSETTEETIGSSSETAEDRVEESTSSGSLDYEVGCVDDSYCTQTELPYCNQETFYCVVCATVLDCTKGERCTSLGVCESLLAAEEGSGAEKGTEASNEGVESGESEGSTEPGSGKPVLPESGMNEGPTFDKVNKAGLARGFAPSEEQGFFSRFWDWIRFWN